MEDGVFGGAPASEKFRDVLFGVAIVARAVFRPGRIVDRALHIDNQQGGFVQLSSAHELDNFDEGACFGNRIRPEIPADNLTIEFDGDAGGLEVECANDIEQRRSRRETAAFTVDCNLFFSAQETSCIIIDFAPKSG